MKHYNNYKAFSLIEVLIFVVVFSLFFVTAASIVTTTLRITKENQNKIKASHYVEELREWLRSEKETNWGGSIYVGSINSFTEQVSQSSPTTGFCLIHPPLGHGLPAAQATVNLPLIANIGGLQHSPQLL